MAGLRFLLPMPHPRRCHSQRAVRGQSSCLSFLRGLFVPNSKPVYPGASLAPGLLILSGPAYNVLPTASPSHVTTSCTFSVSFLNRIRVVQSCGCFPRTVERRKTSSGVTVKSCWRRELIGTEDRGKTVWRRTRRAEGNASLGVRCVD